MDFFSYTGLRQYDKKAPKLTFYEKEQFDIFPVSSYIV